MLVTADPNNRIDRLDCRHCWHNSGVVPPSISDVPKLVRICCWCGATKEVATVTTRAYDRHGPYLPITQLME